MKTILTALALVLPLAAQATQTVQTSTLTFSNLSHEANWTSLPQDVGLTILSDTAGATTITTPSWGNVLNLTYGSSGGIGEDYWLAMKLAPKAGYVITGFSFSATVSGVLEANSVPPPDVPPEAFTPGVAKNEAGIYLPDGAGGTTGKLLHDVTDAQQYAFERHDLSIDHATDFLFQTRVYATTQYAHWETPTGGGKWGSYAEVHLNDPRLTIYTALAPVPEPESWAMLLGGLALVGVAARRRKQ